MSIQQDITDLLQVESSLSVPVRQALEEVVGLLKTTKDSLLTVCREAEIAHTEEALRRAYKGLNRIVRLFVEAAPGSTHDARVLEAVASVQSTGRWEAALGSASSIMEASKNYKTALCQELAAKIRRWEETDRIDEEADNEMFSLMLAGTSPADTLSKDSAASKKRGLSSIPELGKIPRRSKVPALASLSRISGLNSNGSPNKRILLTREKLRAGLHDHRGLLDLSDSSTNALERTKRLELLKSSGLLPESKGSKFTGKLNAATTRLELGLGGQSVSDTLLFGAKVLSIPGVLSDKNISDIESNNVEADTTWSHQNAYGKQLIAGCLHQAKTIFQLFDEVLWGQPPEVSIEKTHQSIKSLLQSSDALSVLGIQDDTDEDLVTAHHEFIKKIIEAVSPILPIALRNKSLDSGYFRTALQLLGAAELLFTRYESDIRGEANPAGFVGLSSLLHSDLEEGVVFSEKLKPLKDSLVALRAQYQTSLGLGDAFPKDSMARKKNKAKRQRRRPFSRGRWYGSQGLNRQQHEQLPFMYQGGQPFGPAGQQAIQGSGRGAVAPVNAARGRCYAFQAGECRRGSGCRYSHQV